MLGTVIYRHSDCRREVGVTSTWLIFLYYYYYYYYYYLSYLPLRLAVYAAGRS